MHESAAFIDTIVKLLHVTKQSTIINAHTRALNVICAFLFGTIFAIKSAIVGAPVKISDKVTNRYVHPIISII
ncbi:hypothetical protein FACS189459_5680 [Bacilli bacterium]|nr:hypothetical protein FACS189459_5680 [Bacilli bacterium]